jgi:predicted CopG family antitoxin
MALTRPRKLSLMISDDEYVMLQAIAAREGLTASDVVRQFIRKRHDELPAETAPARAKAGKTTKTAKRRK